MLHFGEMGSFLDTIGWPATAGTLQDWGGWLVTNLQQASSLSQARELLEDFYRNGDPLATAVALSLLVSIFVFVASLPTNNHSWVSGWAGGGPTW